MPFSVYALGLAVFAQGTSEFMLSGLLSGISHDLHVSIPAAGLLTSAFAVGMVLGAPAMALLGRNWPRRRALLSFLCVFAAVHVIGAVTSSYGVLLATRVVAAVANAGFWAVALVTAVALAGPAARARATSVVVGGVTVACVAGVPAGAWLGGQWGWRAAFWAVALVALAGPRRDRGDDSGGTPRGHPAERVHRAADAGRVPAAADPADERTRPGSDLLRVLLPRTGRPAHHRTRRRVGAGAARSVRRGLVHRGRRLRPDHRLPSGRADCGRSGRSDRRLGPVRGKHAAARLRWSRSSSSRACSRSAPERR